MEKVPKWYQQRFIILVICLIIYYNSKNMNCFKQIEDEECENVI